MQYRLGNASFLEVKYNPEKEGNTMVFLHDSLGCISLWRDFPEKLTQLTNTNAFIYDRLGYGKSSALKLPRKTNYLEAEADILMELMDHYNIQNPILFGHSDGGTIALIAAAKYPNKIKAIITEGAHIYAESLTLEGIRNFKALYRSSNIKERLKKYHFDKVEEVVSAWVDTWLSKSFHDFNISDQLSAINCPSFILQGENDEFGTVQQLIDIKALVSGKCETHLIPEIGHNPHKESPNLTLQLVKKFINQLE